MARPGRRGGELSGKILLLDFELFPNLCYTWGAYEQNVIKIVRPRMICSVAWKFVGEKKAHVLALPDFKEYKGSPFTNDGLMRHTRDLFNEASIIVGHNLDNFDLKRGRVDIIKNEIDPPADFKTIDTLKIARQKFGFNSNRLNDLCEFLGGPSKVRHEGFPLWEACMNGDMAAWSRMRKYNLGDVDPCLEFIYKKLSPWHRPRWLQRLERGLK
jgi:hypothetical protein